VSRDENTNFIYWSVENRVKIMVIVMVAVMGMGMVRIMVMFMDIVKVKVCDMVRIICMVRVIEGFAMIPLIYTGLLNTKTQSWSRSGSWSYSSSMLWSSSWSWSVSRSFSWRESR